MKKLLLIPGVLVAICIILFSFGESKLLSEKQLAHQKFIAYNNQTSPVDNFPSAIKNTFETNGYKITDIVKISKSENKDNTAYEFIVTKNNKKWVLKYDEKGLLIGFPSD